MKDKIIPKPIETDNYRIFSAEGRYQVIDNDSGIPQSGKYFIDTRVVGQSGGAYKEWEMMIRVQPDNQIAPNDDNYYDTPAIYRNEGEIIRLWEPKDDPTGNLAEKFHSAVATSIKRGYSPEMIVNATFELLKRYRP